MLSFSAKPNNQVSSAESTHDDSCITFSFNGATDPELSLSLDCSEIGQFPSIISHVLIIIIVHMFIEALINEAGIEPCDSTVSFKNDGMNFF